MAVDSIVRISNYQLAPASGAQNEERKRDGSGQKKSEKDSTENKKGSSFASTLADSERSSSPPENELTSQIIDSKKIVQLLSQRPMCPVLHRKRVSSYLKASSSPQRRQDSVTKKSE